MSNAANAIVDKDVVKNSLEFACRLFLEANEHEAKWQAEVTARVNQGVLEETPSEANLRRNVESIREELRIARFMLGRNVTNCPAVIATLANLK